MKKIVFIIATLYSIVSLAQAQTNKSKTSKMDQEFLSKQADGLYAKFETNKGTIITNLEFKKTPLTVANFVGLAEGKLANTFRTEGQPYYDGLKFHRVIANFMIQGGCPLGNGSGGPGYKFADEIDTTLKHNVPGILSMANSGAGTSTNGSQFFITHVATPWLNGNHSVFGHVIQGMDVVNKIAQNDTIVKISILRKGKEAEAFDAKTKFEEAKLRAAKKESEDIIKREAALGELIKEYTNQTPSGLRYKVLTEGTGAKPVATSNVKVHYTGMFLDGKVFDSSVQRGTPIDFGLSQVIPGWTEGVQLMKEGAKYKFFIPYKLAYGEAGYPGAIPPKSDLIFEVELIKVNTQ